MSNLALAKQDMTIDYRERSFALRAYRDEGSWHSVIIENKTPLRNTLPPTADAAKCLAEAVAFVTAAVRSEERRVGKECRAQSSRYHDIDEDIIQLMSRHLDS